MAKLRLKHLWFEGEATLYFYEGERPVHKGIVEFTPKDNPAWLKNSWIRGYRVDADTGETVLPSDLEDLVKAKAHQRKPAESA